LSVARRQAGEGMKGRYVESLTWVEAESALREGPTLLLPVGARTKEHGPHLPLDTDFRLAEYLARRIAERCAVLVAPALAYGFYPAFTEYPGSASIGFEAFRDTVADVCGSFAAHGAARCYVLNTGISTLRPLEAARERLAERGIRMRYTDFERACASGRARVETQPRGTHADEVETSMLLYIAPEVVRLERARPELAEDRGGPVGLTRDPQGTEGVFSATGSWGDPTRATRAKGEVVVESMVEYLVSDVEGFAADA
jgi:creatinine amidohydrolase